MALLSIGDGFAQDGRQRDYQTIVADGLAQLPISDTQKRNKVMAELTETGSKGIEMIAGMLVPADKGKNSVAEYAISGIVGYTTASASPQQHDAIRKGLANAIAACTDNANRAFLLSQLQLCATPQDTPVFTQYLKDPYLADHALRGLVATTGSDDIVVDLMKQDAAPRIVLAHAAYERKLAAAEPILLEWLKDADKETAQMIFKTLSACGSSASLKILEKAAKSEEYGWNKKKEATAAYVNLLARMTTNGESGKAVKACKKLLKNPQAHLRGAALNIIVATEGKEALSFVHAALKDADIEVRNNALRSLNKFADEEVYAAVAGWLSSLTEAARTDVIRWFGNRHASSQVAAVVNAIQSDNEELATAGIESAGRIGGEKALQALISLLDGKYSVPVGKALLAFNGNINDGIKKAFDGNVSAQVAALKLCAKRSIPEVSERIFSLLASSDPKIKDAAYNALPGIVKFTDFNRLNSLLSSSDSRYVSQLQQALIQSIKSETSEKQYQAVATCMKQSSAPALYYPILAHTNTAEAIELLHKELMTANGSAAFDALLKIENPAMIDVLYRIAGEKPVFKEPALARYISLVTKSDLQGVKKYKLYKQAMELNPAAETEKKILKALANIRRYPALMLAAKYMYQPETAAQAAATVKTIVAKSEERLGGDSVKIALEKAQAIYKTLPGADAGYAVDEINTLLSKLQDIQIFTLSPEEQKEGYEMLFDGTSLQKWTGNKDSYIIENGTIYVSAGYGSGGNLYTQKEYSDFVLRFEFCFEREGVNNGIGVRTRHGVDAAYDGMEIQILDHDAPIYKNLREYQQHGSVYGIIPAKRVKFPEHGSWNVEEIRVVGDRITVTVNGEVILDGDIRKACKGHNVSKDGSKKNPYTVDHRNHPGLFNKKGPIALCGHGAGIRFRNMRVLDLGQ